MITRKSVAILAITLAVVLGVTAAHSYQTSKAVTNQLEVLQSVVAPTDNYTASVYDDVIVLSDEPAGKELVLPVRNVPTGKVFVVSNATGTTCVLLTTAGNGNSLERGPHMLYPGIWVSVVWTGTQYRYVTENIF